LKLCSTSTGSSSTSKLYSPTPWVLGGNLPLQPIINAHKRPSDAASVQAVRPRCPNSG